MKTSSHHHYCISIGKTESFQKLGNNLPNCFVFSKHYTSREGLHTMVIPLATALSLMRLK